MSSESISSVESVKLLPLLGFLFMWSKGLQKGSPGGKLRQFQCSPHWHPFSQASLSCAACFQHVNMVGTHFASERVRVCRKTANKGWMIRPDASVHNCYSLNCGPHKFICWSPNPWYFRMWLSLEKGSLKRRLKSNEVVRMGPNSIWLVSL